MLDFWQNIYSQFTPVAFSLGFLKVHWYGIMYAFAFGIAIYMAYYFFKKGDTGLSKDELDSYIIWAEVGVILGARLGFVLFYDDHLMYYLTQPWEIFNPFMDGVFVGISGMSYHGALAGFIISTLLFAKKNKISFYKLTDLAAICTPLAYVFGRIGNFINQELVGKITDVPWGIYVFGELRHPSQLYEAFFEGLVVFAILILYKKYKKFDGELAMAYVILYSIARIGCEVFRQPDVQLGYLLNTSWLSMGMVISFVFVVAISMLYIYTLYKISKNKDLIKTKNNINVGKRNKKRK
jgi:phosphatidylglycerol:prolipoprotein diacylglycerol transferase